MPIVLCSLGDASITEGEVSEAFQFAVLKQLPVIYLIQDNDWGISVSSDEARRMDAFEYAAGFPGMERIRIDGSDFEQSFELMNMVINSVRKDRGPYIVQAKVPLLNHHTSGVRKESYRSKDDLEKHFLNDPLPKLKHQLIAAGISESEILSVEKETEKNVKEDFHKACLASDP